MSRKTPLAGDRYAYPTSGNIAIEMEVLRVARDGSWADIRCTDRNGSKWTKRQPTPIPGDLLNVAS